MRDAKQYWFPAKRYGWGWGLPITWQGWWVFVGFFALLAIGAFWFLPQKNTFGFFLYAAVITLSLVFVCYVKGEPPAWRWGRNDGQAAALCNAASGSVPCAKGDIHARGSPAENVPRPVRSALEGRRSPARNLR